VIARKFAAPLIAFTLAATAAPAFAQGAFPAPLPNQPANASPFPPVNASQPSAASPFPPPNAAASAPSPFDRGAAPVGGAGLGGAGLGGPPAAGGPPPGVAAAQEACMKQFMPLREEAERRAKLIKAASDRKAPAQEACKVISNFAQAEGRLVNFVKTKQQSCGIPAEVGKTLATNHSKTNQMMKQVCNAATAQPAGPAGPSLSEALGSSVLPEAAPARRSGGSTFDTISGNVLAR
jgi:hypothetical protein